MQVTKRERDKFDQKINLRNIFSLVVIFYLYYYFLYLNILKTFFNFNICLIIRFMVTLEIIFAVEVSVFR